MATDMTPPEILVGQRDIFGGEVTSPPAFSQAAPPPRDFGGGAPQDFAGHAPQDFVEVTPRVSHVTAPPTEYSPDWPPEGCTLVPAERITDAIVGMTIVSCNRDADETRLELQGAECPSITLVITDDGYWTAVV